MPVRFHWEGVGAPVLNNGFFLSKNPVILVESHESKGCDSVGALLIKLFAGDSENMHSPHIRTRLGQLSGWAGIASNLLLFVLKFLLGQLSGSISITADAFNNLSDCASSVITVVGFRLSGKPADEQHPYGHARYEYVSGLVVSILILLIGLEFFQSSLRKILNPRPVGLTPVMIAALLAAIFIKLWQGLFYREIGKRIHSASLAASARDSFNDCITTGAVLAGAVIIYLTEWNLDGWMGLAVSVFILISGASLVRDILNPLLGSAPESELVERLRNTILASPTVIGMHDLMVHSYGPERCFASVHVEMPADQDILVSHDIVDRIEREVFAQMNVNLVIHLDPVITNDARLNELREIVREAALGIDPAADVHDLRVAEYKTHQNLIFEISVPPRLTMSDAEIRRLLRERIAARHPVYRCVITVDRSCTSTQDADYRG